MALQFILALLLLKIPVVQSAFLALNSVVEGLARATEVGTSFVFGYLGGGPLPFEATLGGFRIMLKPGWVKRRLVVGAKIREGIGEQATLAWIMNSQIGSSARLEGFLERRVLGAPRRPIEQQDSMGLQSSRGMALFTIDALPDVVEANQHLEVVNLGRKDDPARPEALFLYIRTEKKKAASE